MGLTIKNESFAKLIPAFVLTLLFSSTVYSGNAPVSTARAPLPVPNYDCPDFPNTSNMPPMARQQLGIAVETGASVRRLMSRAGREQLWEDTEKGGTEKALRGVREHAVLFAIACGPNDQAYRSGVCLNFMSQCIAHGGGNCDLCSRAWAAKYCNDTLSNIVNAPLDTIEDILDGIDSGGEWEVIMSIAGRANDPELLKRLKGARKKFIDDPIKENCYAIF